MTITTLNTETHAHCTGIIISSEIAPHMYTYFHLLCTEVLLSALKHSSTPSSKSDFKVLWLPINSGFDSTGTQSPNVCCAAKIKKIQHAIHYRSNTFVIQIKRNLKFLYKLTVVACRLTNPLTDWLTVPVTCNQQSKHVMLQTTLLTQACANYILQLSRFWWELQIVGGNLVSTFAKSSALLLSCWYVFQMQWVQENKVKVNIQNPILAS